MARVVNELIHIVLNGDAIVKQYFGTGPLMVKLPGERGELRAQSGDYICYDGDAAVGVVGGHYIDEMREDKDTLDESDVIPTGAHLEATILDNSGAPLIGTVVVLLQGGVQLAEGRTNAEGLVVFNVLPGTYQLRPKNAALGPEQTVEAVIETEELPPPPEGGVLGARRDKPSIGKPKPDNSLPGEGRFDIGGRPDPHGDYDSKGKLLPKR